MICDQPAVAVAHPAYHAIAKREAEAEADADAQYGYGYAGYHAAPLVAPVAHAVAHSVKSTIKHACRTAVTKVACEPVENVIPTTKCEAVTTEHLSHAAVAAPCRRPRRCSLRQVHHQARMQDRRHRALRW